MRMYIDDNRDWTGMTSQQQKEWLKTGGNGKKKCWDGCTDGCGYEEDDARKI